jgi:ribosome recycling factor
MIDEVMSELAAATDKAHEALKRDLGRLRTGRAHAGLLDGVRVDYYGQVTPLAQMATINVPEARLITVKPWDKSQTQAVEKALRESDLGLNPQVSGELIRIPIPPLSEERRKDLVKVAKRTGEECRVTVRKARHDALDMLAEIKKEGAASEDEVERAKKKVEDHIAEAGKEVERIVQAKEKDILTV